MDYNKRTKGHIRFGTWMEGDGCYEWNILCGFVGVAMATVMHMNVGLGISIGMVIGLAVGSSMKKEE